MPPSRLRFLSARQRKLWLWSIAIVAGLAGLGVFVAWVDRVRDTDRSDARAGVTSTFKEAAVAGASPVRFTDVTLASGIRMRHGAPRRQRALPEDNGSGLAWGDYDGDGDWDLYVVNHPGIACREPEATAGNRLYRNDGDGFTDVTDRAGVADRAGFGMGAVFVDYDADGDADLHVTNRGPNRLYRNNGDGTFVDVAAEAGVADPRWGTGTAWGDFDRDGHVDFYLCNYVEYDSDGTEPPAGAGEEASYDGVPYTLNPNSYDPQPNRLFRNRGDGTFEDVTEQGEVENADGRSLAATFCDLDGDGWLDLYVNNDVSPNRLYLNSGDELAGDGRPFFLDVSAVTGTADPRGSMGLSVAETGELTGEADGRPDLFITHWVAQENALYQSLVTKVGKLQYRERARQARLAEISIDRVGWGCAFAELDGDGRVDLVVANGSTLEQATNAALLRPEPLFLFINDGAGFSDVAPLAGEAGTRAYNARGLAVADFDQDGDVDLAISTNQGAPHLLRNDTRTTHRTLAVRLEGRAAACLGARIEVVAGGRRQLRWWGADVSYLSMHAPEVLFGLGSAGHAEVVRVHWSDGRESELAGVAAGVVRIRHPSAEAGADGAAQGEAPTR